jgi:hypothetical protein
MARYDKYGNNDDRTLEDRDFGFKGYNNRLRPDQLPQGFLSSSINGRLDLNGEWQVRKGIENISAPFTVAGDSIRLPLAGESTRLLLPFRIKSATVSGGTTVTIETSDENNVATNHNLSTDDKVVVEGLKYSTGEADPNGEHTITKTSDTTFTFPLTTSATSYIVTEGVIFDQQTNTAWRAFPSDPVTYGSAANYAELNQQLFLPHVGGSQVLTLSDAENTEVTSACRFSDNSVSTDEFVIMSSVTNAVAVNVNDKSSFNLPFKSGETAPPESDLLQVLNKIILFRNQQAALECKKFFKPINIASAVRANNSSTITITTTQPHNLSNSDFIGIDNLTTGSNDADPNGAFQVTISSTDNKVFTYVLTGSQTGSDSYTAASGSFGFVVPAFDEVPNGEYTQPIEVAISQGDFAIVENRGVVHENPDNYKVGDEIECLGDVPGASQVSGILVGVKFTVANIFPSGTETSVTKIANDGNGHNNPEYGSLYQYTVTAPNHGLSVGEPIDISQASTGTYNSNWFVAADSDPNSFKFYSTSNITTLGDGTSEVAKVASSEGFNFFLQGDKTSEHILEYESYLAQPVFSKRIPLSLGYIHMPNPPYGIYHQKRLVVPFFYDVTDLGAVTDRGNRDELVMSDLLDTDTYDAVFGQFRFNAGGADFNVGLHSFSEDILVVFNRNSIHLVANSLNLQSAIVKNLTDEVGCLARKSIIQVGNRILFLSDNGVYAIDFQDEYNLRGNELPFSEPISANIANINQENAHKATAVYFDNRYYIAVPMNFIKGDTTNQVFFTEREALEYVDPTTNRGNTFDPTDSTKNLLVRVQASENNVVLVYNFLNQSWESLDYVGSQSSNVGHGIEENWNILDLVVAGRGNARGVYVVNSKGGVHRYDNVVLGEDAVITEIGLTTPSLKNIQGFSTTRMYNFGDIDRKRFNNFELMAEASEDETAFFRMAGVTENIDSNFIVKDIDISSKEEDVAIRGRIGNKRAYGMQFRLQNTRGRPKFKGLKVAAAETFRSLNKAE